MFDFGASFDWIAKHSYWLTEWIMTGYIYDFNAFQMKCVNFVCKNQMSKFSQDSNSQEVIESSPNKQESSLKPKR